MTEKQQHKSDDGEVSNNTLLPLSFRYLHAKAPSSKSDRARKQKSQLYETHQQSTSVWATDTEAQNPTPSFGHVIEWFRAQRSWFYILFLTHTAPKTSDQDPSPSSSLPFAKRTCYKQASLLPPLDDENRANIPSLLFHAQLLPEVYPRIAFIMHD